MRMVTVVPALTAPVPTVHVIVGALTLNVHAPVPAEKLAFIFPVERLLNAKVEAEGEAVLLAEPGKPMTIVPPIGIVVAAVN